MKSNESQNDCPLFSRCSIGKNKWFWVTYPSFAAICDRAVDDSGYATSASEAEEQARASLTARLGGIVAHKMQNSFAAYVYHFRLIRMRSAQTSSSDEVKQTEYVYSDYDSEYDGQWHSHPHRIVKKTAKQVYVEYQTDRWTENGNTFYDVQTFILDRHELESKGEVWSRRQRDFFYTTPCDKRRKPSKPTCFEILGLEVGATTADICVAYRTLAKECHPDHGGTAEDFKKLQQAYEMALSRLSP
jgi:hypothetical protein